MIAAVRRGNLLESSAQTLVNTVNTVGVMGKGIALEFKKQFPEMYADYVARCEAGDVQLGRPYLYKRLVAPWIINFPTKEHWRSVSRFGAIVDGLDYLEKYLDRWGVESLAVPPLGCGHGQLEWDVVGPTLFRFFDRLSIPVELYAPFDVDDASTTRRFLSHEAPGSAGGGQFLSPTLIVLAEVAARLESERYSWPVGHTRFQKLCYFTAAAGVPLGLQFEERRFGPFAEGIKRVISRLVNNGVLVEEASGRYQLLRPGPTFGDVRSRFSGTLEEHSGAIDRVVDLLLRLSPARTELAATVHFTATALTSRMGRSPSDEEVAAEVKRWKKGKFPARDVTATLATLTMHGWLDLGATPLIERQYDSVTTFA